MRLVTVGGGKELCGLPCYSFLHLRFAFQFLSCFRTYLLCISFVAIVVSGTLVTPTANKKMVAICVVTRVKIPRSTLELELY